MDKMLLNEEMSFVEWAHFDENEKLVSSVGKKVEVEVLELDYVRIEGKYYKLGKMFMNMRELKEVEKHPGRCMRIEMYFPQGQPEGEITEDIKTAIERLGYSVGDIDWEDDEYNLYEVEEEQ